MYGDPADKTTGNAVWCMHAHVLVQAHVHGHETAPSTWRSCTVGADDATGALKRRRELVAGFWTFARASANAPAKAQGSNGRHHAN